MKLIEKTNFYYLIYTLFIFALGTVLFYFLVKKVLIDGVDDILHAEKLQLIENLSYEKNINALKSSQNIVIKVRSVGQSSPDIFNTIVVADDQGKSIDYRQLTSVFEHQNQYYEIKLRQSLDEVETLIDSILPLEVVLFLLLLAGVLYIGRQVSNTVWKPFYELLDQLRNYDLGQVGTIKYSSTKINEFDALGESLEKMTLKIESDFRSQKEFNENSAHELQTPIAIIKNKLELLIQSQNMGEKEMLLAQSMFEALRRLGSVNKGLILLSKIDNAQYSDIKPVNLSAVIVRILENFEETIAEKQLQLTLNIEVDTIVETNEILVEILMVNLISNAIKHNIEEGILRISLQDEIFIISNSGQLPHANPNSLFERFKKESTLENSVGLGLSIVKKVCDYLGFSIDFKYLHETHVMTVRF